MTAEVTRLVSPYFGDGGVPRPVAAAAKRWGAGVATGSLNLREDAVSLEPWRVAIAGEWVRRHGSPAEAAALSGLEAGERVASWFVDEPGGG